MAEITKLITPQHGAEWKGYQEEEKKVNDPGTFGDTAWYLSKDALESARDRFMKAGTREGVAGNFPETDNNLLKAYQTAVGYLADQGLAGLDLTDAAFRAAVGFAVEAVPGQTAQEEKRLARDIVGGTEGMAGTTFGITRKIPSTKEIMDGLELAGSKIPVDIDNTTIRMFIGPTARSPERTITTGEDTPRSMTASGKSAWEISDADMRVIASQAPVGDLKDTLDPDFSGMKLSDFLGHDELFEQYPELKDQKFTLFDSSKYSKYKGMKGFYHEDSGMMGLNVNIIKEPNEFMDVLVHEIQHRVQEIEGWPLGTSPGNPDVAYMSRANPNADLDYALEGNKPFSKDGITFFYLTNEGEVQAFNTTYRRNFDLQERRDVPPRSTEHVKRRYQWNQNQIPATLKSSDSTGAKEEYDQGGLVNDPVLNLNEGGPVVGEQLSLFDEGGMMDGGPSRDPVSGNEVPLGSSAEEVRDDIDAKLSEGEYIVPADVVQFFGVKFFEDLRDRAKAGLKDMDMRGRIGGEPAGDDDDLTPEELAEIEAIVKGGPLKMATGGMVPQFGMPQMATSGGPQPFSTPGPEQLDKRTEDQVTQQTPVPPSSLPGRTVFGQNPTMGMPGQTSPTQAPAEPEGETDYKIYVNDQGVMKVIPFVDGEPTVEIPEGFKPQGSTEEPIEELEVDEDMWDRGEQDKPTKEKDYWNMGGEDLLKSSEMGLKVGNFTEAAIPRIGGMVLGAMGIPFAGLGGQVLSKIGVGERANIGVASALANAQIARARGDIATAEAIESAAVENSRYESMEDLKSNNMLMDRVDRMYERRRTNSDVADQQIAEATGRSPNRSSEDRRDTPEFSSRRSGNDNVERGAGEERREGKTSGNDYSGVSGASEPDRSFGGTTKGVSGSSGGRRSDYSMESDPDLSFGGNSGSVSTSGIGVDPGDFKTSSDYSGKSTVEDEELSFKKGGLAVRPTRKKPTKNNKGLATRTK